MSDFTWVINQDGGHWLCPNAALEDQLALGWRVAEAPPREPNPAVDERIAWERQQQELRAAEAAAADTKSTKAARRGETQEG